MSLFKWLVPISETPALKSHKRYRADERVHVQYPQFTRQSKIAYLLLLRTAIGTFLSDKQSWEKKPTTSAKANQMPASQRKIPKYHTLHTIVFRIISSRH